MIVGVCGFGFGARVFGYALVRNLFQGRWALILTGIHCLSLATTSANPPLAEPLARTLPRRDPASGCRRPPDTDKLERSLPSL